MAAMQRTLSPIQKKKARKPNFSFAEMNVLRSQVKGNFELLMSKQTNVVTNQKKKEKWQEITDSINALGVGPRTLKEVKDKWGNMTKVVKQKHVEQTEKTNQDQQIYALYKDSPSFNGIEGGIEVPVTVSEPSLASSSELSHEDVADSNQSATEAVWSNALDQHHANLEKNNSDHNEDDAETSASCSNQSSTLSSGSRKRKFTMQDVHELQCKVLEKELTKLDLQIELLHKLNKDVTDQEVLSAAHIFASFS